MARPALRRSGSLHAVVLVAVLAALPLLARAFAPGLPTGEILGISAPSLSGYLATSDPTPTGGVRPIATQRAVALDGSLSRAPSLAIAVSSAALGTSWRGNQSLNGVDLRTGSLNVECVVSGRPILVFEDHTHRVHGHG